ncbi:MAG TPA: beta-galactosidase [Rhodoferax sp.]
MTFSVTATGSHLSYQWHKDGSAIAGAISSSFSMASATATDAGVYTVVITNAAGSITSASATLTIASRSVAKPTGFFAMTGLTTTALAKADLLSLPYVSGMTSYIAWKDLEPTKGHYVFDRIDNDIALAKSYGKKLTLGVFTGKDSIPDWVAAEGVRMWVTGQGNTLIYPTDQTFVSLWSARVQALGARYADNDTVVQVTICGPTGTLCGPRYPELPPGVVYADLVSTWNQVIAAYLQAFPNTYKNFEVQLSTNGYNANLPVDLFAGIALDVKIGPFADFLSDTGPTDTSITGAAYITAAKGRNWCGFQMVSPLGDKIGDAILRGRGFGCNYFEIYTGDLQQQGAILSGLAL